MKRKDKLKSLLSLVKTLNKKSQDEPIYKKPKPIINEKNEASTWRQKTTT